MKNQIPARPTSHLPSEAPRAGLVAAGSRAPLWFVVRVLRTKVHPAASGFCSCGACGHQVSVAARATGWPASTLRTALGASSGESGAAAVAGQPVRRALHAQVGSCATVVVAGERVPAGVGLLRLAAAGLPD